MISTHTFMLLKTNPKAERPKQTMTIGSCIEDEMNISWEESLLDMLSLGFRLEAVINFKGFVLIIFISMLHLLLFLNKLFLHGSLHFSYTLIASHQIC